MVGPTDLAFDLTTLVCLQRVGRTFLENRELSRLVIEAAGRLQRFKLIEIGIVVEDHCVCGRHLLASSSEIRFYCRQS